MASFMCPNCGKENELSQAPQAGSLIRCGQCGKMFSAAASREAQRLAPKESVPNKAETVRPEATAEPGEIAKDLAQSYFSDIPDGAFAKDGADSSEKVWSAEEEISEEEKRLQQQRLFQFAQESAEKKKEKEKAEQESVFAIPQHTSQKRFVREKKQQRVVYWLLLLLACLIPALRMVIGRASASVRQFSWMQPQIIPSLLYFCAALVLLFHLLRRTTTPKWIPAALLLVPLVLDGWYLLPGLANLIGPGFWLNLSNTVKIAVALFALIMSVQARKHPALAYKGAETIDG